jgi:formylglycine-generating enzyme required for sulfatase activity
MPLPVLVIPATIAIAKSAPFWAPFAAPIISAVSGGFNRLVGNQYNRETQVMLESKREEMQLTQLKFQYLQQKDTQSFQSDLQGKNHEHQRLQQRENQTHQLDLQNNSYDRQLDLQSNSHDFQRSQQRDNQIFQIDLQNNSYDRQLDLQSNSHDFQQSQQRDAQAFQLAMSQLSADRQAQLQEYIQQCNARMQKDSQMFLAWKWQEEKSLQLAVVEYGRETQLMLAILNRETNMQSIEENQILQNWPLILMPAQIVKATDRMPLRVILSPPDVDYDKFANPNKDGNKRKLPDLEKGLSAGLRQFVSQHYGNHQQTQRAVQLLDGAWQSKKYRDGASIQALHSKLSTESILILQTSIDGDRLNFDYNFWSNDSEPIHQSVLANHKFVDLLYDSAKERARDWKGQRDLLVEFGEDPAHHHPINTHNLALLEKEERLAQAGIDINQIQSRYIPADEDFESFKEWLVTYHSFILALTTDCYYLVQGNITPLLPQILPELFTVDLYPRPLELMLTSYEQTIDAFAVERSTIVPDLYLNLAATFQPFEDRTYARRCLLKSIQALLNQRPQISGLIGQDLAAYLSVLPNYLITADREYVAKLNSLLAAVEIDVQFDLVRICLQRGIDRAHQENYLGAIAEFTLLIALDSRLAPAYFNRGLAYSKLEQYPAAITDFIHHLDLVPNSPDTYSSRGNIYYKQGEYQLALQDYDRALQIAPNHPAALKGKDLAYQAIAAKLRQQEEEKNSKGKPFSFEVVRVNSRGEIIQREQKQASAITQNLPQGATLERVYIPGGKFLMGSPDGVGNATEHPQHQVTIAPFFMSKYPVTQAQWRAVASLPQEQRKLDSAPSHFKGDNRPVEQVSWHDAVEFCARLSRYTGDVYRLPSEAEWEYACRAETTTPYYFGDTITPQLVNYDGNYTYGDAPKGEYRTQTTDVGIFPPNNFGLYDLHGNVWEWCADMWSDSYAGAPKNGSIWEKGDNNRSPLRGGSWDDDPGYCRSAYRFFFTRGNANDRFGFRIVCE